MPTVDGLPACSCLAAWIPAYRAELKRQNVSPIRFTRLIYRAGGTSGNTHWPGGGGDGILNGVGDYDKAVKIAREMGAAAWHRTPKQGFIHHIHFVLNGCPHNSGGRYQIRALRLGRNGLGWQGMGGKDDGPAPRKLRTYKQGIAWAKAQATPPTVIRAALSNLPDESKLPNAEARIAAGVPLVQKQGAPTFIAWNELVGIKGEDNASDHARAVDAELSSKWLLVKPTLRLNENYISYRRDLLEVVAQYEDKVLPSEHGGRHLTRVAFKYKPTGMVFAVGVTHLVPTAGSEREKSRQKQAGDAHRYLENVSQLHDDCPFILLGDMNTHHDLKALVAAGMKRASRWADNTHGQSKAATYTNYEKTKPSTNPDWAIDQIWFSPHWYVDEWEVLQNLTATGTYRKPRPSDHDPSVAQAHNN